MPKKKTKPVFAPMNPPVAKTSKRGDPSIGKKRQKTARSEAIGKALMMKGA